MAVCCISVEEIQRPFRLFEHQVQVMGIKSEADQSGRSCWGAITFKAKIDPFDFTQDFERVTLEVGPGESWRFYNARIALMSGSMLNLDHFVMIFERCERVVEI